MITGRVTDAEGRPVIQQKVNLFPVDAAIAFAITKQRRPPLNLPALDWNDTVASTMYGLRVVAIRSRRDEVTMVFSVGFGQTRSGYQQVFHPEVTEQAKPRLSKSSKAVKLTTSILTWVPQYKRFRSVGESWM